MQYLSKQQTTQTGCLFSIWAYEKCMTFKDIFPGLSRSWNFQEKIQNFPGLSRRHGNPGYAKPQRLHCTYSWLDAFCSDSCCSSKRRCERKNSQSSRSIFWRKFNAVYSHNVLHTNYQLTCTAANNDENAQHQRRPRHMIQSNNHFPGIEAIIWRTLTVDTAY